MAGSLTTEDLCAILRHGQVAADSSSASPGDGLPSGPRAAVPERSTEISGLYQLLG